MCLNILYSECFMHIKERMLIGIPIGFASGLHLASTLFITLFSGGSFVVHQGKESIIFVFLILVSIFSFFGVHCMSDNSQSKTEKEFRC
jgi:hypothetical protein